MPITIGAILTGAGALLGLIGLLVAGVPPFKHGWDHMFNRMWANIDYSVMEAIELHRKGLIDWEMARVAAKKKGINETRFRILFDGTKRLLDANDLLMLKWRGEIDEEHFTNSMLKLGFLEGDIPRFETVRRFMPNVRDLVVFSAKEVFEEDMVVAVGLDDEFENLDLSWFAKVGVDEETAKMFWRSHWDHPSWIRVSDMFHRGLITEDDLERWFRLVEFPPFWREALKGVLYNMPTRVDLRRFYDFQIIDYDTLVAEYRRSGYTEQDAIRLSQLAVHDAAVTEKDVTRTIIEKGFVIGELTRDEALAMLVSIGYDETESELLISIKERAIQDDVLELKINSCLKNYVNGIIDIYELGKRLDALNIPAAYKDIIMNEAEVTLQQKIRLPTKADIESWYKKGIIIDTEFTNYLRKLHYTETDISYFLKELQQDKAGD